MQPGIGEAAWIFKTTFNVTEDELAAPNIDLVFEGLDTYAAVTLVWFARSQDVNLRLTP